MSIDIFPWVLTRKEPGNHIALMMHAILQCMFLLALSSQSDDLDAAGPVNLEGLAAQAAEMKQVLGTCAESSG